MGEQIHHSSEQKTEDKDLLNLGRYLHTRMGVRIRYVGTLINPFLASVPILYFLKTPENQIFFVAF